MSFFSTIMITGLGFSIEDTGLALVSKRTGLGLGLGLEHAVLEPIPVSATAELLVSERYAVHSATEIAFPSVRLSVSLSVGNTLELLVNRGIINVIYHKCV